MIYKYNIFYSNNLTTEICCAVESSSKSFLGWQWQYFKDLQQQENLSASLFLGTPFLTTPFRCEGAQGNPRLGESLKNTLTPWYFPEDNTQEFAKVWGPSTWVLSTKRQLGAALNISDSSLKTSHPRTEVSVVVCTGARPLDRNCFYSQNLTCVCSGWSQCFPTNTCLQCLTCVSIQERHFYSSRLISVLALEFPTNVEKTSRGAWKSP